MKYNQEENLFSNFYVSLLTDISLESFYPTISIDILSIERIESCRLHPIMVNNRAIIHRSRLICR